MSYSDDTAAFMFTGQDGKTIPLSAKWKIHDHEYTYWKVTAEGWVFSCDCGRAIVKSNAWMEAEGQKGSGGNSPTTSV